MESENAFARKPIVWKDHEYTHTEKNSDWYCALGLITVAAAVTAIIFNNVLFAIFILVVAFVLAIFASRKPDEVTFSITQRGVKVNDKLYPFKAIKSFGIEEIHPNHPAKLIIEPVAILSTTVIIPLKNTEPDEIHDFLSTFLPEEDHTEPLTHKVMEWFGF